MYTNTDTYLCVAKAMHGDSEWVMIFNATVVFSPPVPGGLPVDVADSEIPPVGGSG
jgi:hypothetical protein